MVRYFYYHVIYVGLINIMLFVPWTLLQHRFDGAVSAMVIAIFVGTFVAFSVTSLFRKFPGKGLPELLKSYMPRGLAVPINLLCAFIWCLAGVLVLYGYATTIQIFFNPDMNTYLYLLLMTLASVWGASRSSRTVQFAQEVLLMVCAPLIIMVLIKALFSPWLDWNAIRVTAGYVGTPPSFISLSAAVFVFAGFNMLVIYNRLMPSNAKIKYRWIIPLFCTFFLFVSFFVPIGFHGTVSVGEYLYIWSFTADSMIMEYGFVYRVLYLFLLLYTALSLIFTMNTWHVAMEFLKSCHPRHEPQTDQYPVPPVNWWINLVFGALTIAYAIWTNEDLNQSLTQGWLILRFIVELLILLLLFWVVIKARRGARGSASAQPSVPGPR